MIEQLKEELVNNYTISNIQVTQEKNMLNISVNFGELEKEINFSVTYNENQELVMDHIKQKLIVIIKEIENNR